MENPSFTDRLKSVAQVVEKFVEHNLIEKEQRDENFRKLAMAFETLLKDSPFRQSSNNSARSVERSNEQSTNEAAGETAATAQPGEFRSVTVQVKRHRHFKGDLPKYQTELASGLDVRAQLEGPVTLEPGQRALIPTGLSFAIPAGYEIQARPRSGWAIRDGVTLLNTPGTIDADYRGEVKIILANFGERAVIVNDQDRIAQLVLVPVFKAAFEEVEELDGTLRGDGGFGSTGR